MKAFTLPVVVASVLVLSSCASQAPAPGAADSTDKPIPHRNGQLDLALASGSYACEMGKRVQVERDYRERVNYRIRLGWNNKDYLLERDNSYSGLPRFRHRDSGLVWVDLPWKSVLLDGKTNKPLVSECRAA